MNLIKVSLIAIIFYSISANCGYKCLEVLQHDETIRVNESINVGSIRFQSRASVAAKQFRNYRINNLETKPSLVIDIDNVTDSQLTVTEIFEKNYNKDGRSPLIIKKVSISDIQVSSKTLYGSSEEMNLNYKNSHLNLTLPEIENWASLNAAINLASRLTQLLKSFGGYEIKIPVEKGTTELFQLVDIANNFFIPIFSTFQVLSNESYLPNSELVQILDSHFELKEETGGQFYLALHGNLKYAPTHLLILQFLLTTLELSKQDQILAQWHKMQKDLMRFRKAKGMGNLNWFMKTISVPLKVQQMSINDIIDDFNFEIFNEDQIIKSLEVIFGLHWPLLINRNHLFDKDNISPQFIQELKKYNSNSLESFFEILFSKSNANPDLVSTFELEDSPGLAKFMGETPPQFFDRFSNEGIFIGMATFSKNKHAAIYEKLNNCSLPNNHGTFAFIRIPEKELKDIKEKLRIMNSFRQKLNFPIFAYQIQLPLIVESNDVSDSFNISIQSPGFKKLNDYLVGDGAKKIESKFIISEYNGIKYVQNRTYDFFRIPLNDKNGILSIPSMNCAQYTYFQAKLIFSQKSFPSFSSPDELGALLNRGAFPGVLFMGAW